MNNASIRAGQRLNLIRPTLSPASTFSTRRKMPSPKIRKIGPLPSEEAKWTELRKIEACTIDLRW